MYFPFDKNKTILLGTNYVTYDPKFTNRSIYFQDMHENASF